MKTKPILFLTFVALISFEACTQENKSEVVALADFKISADVPKEYSLLSSPYNNKQDSLVVRNDLDKIIVSRTIDDERIKVSDSDKQSVAEREADYSKYWIDEAINSKFYDYKIKDKIRFVQNVNGKDDAVILRFSYGNYTFEIIDTRKLTVLISNVDAKEDVKDIFDKFINYRSPSNDNFKVKPEALVKIDASKSYGKIKVTREEAGWFCNAIEWYRDNNKILFLFDKTLTPASPKGGWRYSSPVKTVGGMPYSDSRSFLRFDKSNSVDLSEEYFKKLEFPEIDKEEEISKKASAGTLQGRISESDEELEKIKKK